jgi:hypothetical protein
MDACCCSIDPDSYEQAEAIRVKHVKARKDHECIECGAKIHRGETYEYVSGIWEGRPSSFKTCLICVRIRDDLCCDGFLYGGLSEALWECLGVPL